MGQDLKMEGIGPAIVESQHLTHGSMEEKMDKDYFMVPFIWERQGTNTGFDLVAIRGL